MIKIHSDTYKAFQRTPDPRMAEKDYLECAILDKLFQDSDTDKDFVFAGGGSITKSYNISPRIGHDIDLACTDFEDLPVEHSKKQLNNFRNQFKTFVFDVIKPKFNYILNQDQQFIFLTDRDWQALKTSEKMMSVTTLHLLYKSQYCSDMGHISIDIIPRKYSNDLIQHRAVIPYSVNRPMGDIPTVSYEQTFWDKIYALHSIAKNGLPRFQQELSHHYYDVANIAPSVNLAKTKPLFFDVAEYQSRYTTRQIECPQTTADICLLPNAETLQKLEQDYPKIIQTNPAAQTEWQTIVKQLGQLSQNLKTL